METNNVDFIKNYFHQVPDIDAEEVIKSFCQDIYMIPEHLNIFHMDTFMTPNLNGIIYTITLVSEQPIDTMDLNRVHHWVHELFPDEDIVSARTWVISTKPTYIMQATLSITFND